MAQFGICGNPAAYFDECFSKYGIHEGMEYAGGVDEHEYVAKEQNREMVLKSFSDMVTKERGTTTSEYASGTSYSATSGNLPTLLPIWVSPDIINLSRKETPVYELLPKIAVRGKYYDWNTATFASTNAAFKPEDASQTEYDDTYTRTMFL